MRPSQFGLASLLTIATLTATVSAQGFVPLVDKRFTYPDGIPYKVDTDAGQARGPQLGYNICNSTTEGPQSLCQTAFINSLDDFCLWAPSKPGQTVGEIEGEMIAWCTNGGHGTRIIPAGTLTGVQFTRAPNYVEVVGFMDQTKINMVAGDAGGEMDPHGADNRGNPIGGILFSQAFNGSYQQVVEWHNFNGGNMFCLKACDHRGSQDARYCDHVYDTLGCGANAPSGAKNGVFESCASDDQNFPPNPQVPASSSCSQFESTALFGGGVTVPVPDITGLPVGFSSTSKRSTTTRASSTSVSTPHASPSLAGSAAAPSKTASGAARGSSIPGLAIILGIFWVIFFA